MAKNELTQSQLEDIIKQLSKVDEDEPGTFTSHDAAELMGCHVNTARDRLKALAANGAIEPDKIRRSDAWGMVTKVKGWRILK